MALMDIFRGFRGQSTPAGPVAAVAAPAITGDPSKNNPTVPGDGTAKPPGNEGDKSPLEGFKDLWQNDPNAKKPAGLEVSIPVDGSKMMEAARKIDFTKALSPNTLELIAKGDAAGFLAGINEASQAAYAQASGATAKIVEGALNRQAKVFNEEVLPAALKKHSVASSLRTENPAFENSAVSPLLSMVESQLQSKFPTASAQEITTKAKEYLLGASEVIIGTSASRTVIDKPAAPTKAATARADQDWSLFFDGNAA